MKPNKPWLLYGANGYTGTLLAREALARNMRPILAGRSREPIEWLGRELGCETRTMSLDDPGLARSLEDVGCVLLAAGPFSRTSRPMLDACLKARCHYLDVSGELEVIADCYARHGDAAAGRIAVVPAAGWNVVPMECLAAKLVEKCDRPTNLELGFEGYEVSAGTAKTYSEGIAIGSAHIENGRLTRSPLAWKLRPIPFKNGVQQGLRIPYAELVSCHRATSIANISVFMVPPPSLVTLLKYGPRFSSLMRFASVKYAVDRFAEFRFPGPDDRARRTRRTQIWARVTSADGAWRQGFLETPEPYQFTLATALGAVERVLAGSVAPGAWTPSQAFGSEFVTELGGCAMELESWHDARSRSTTVEVPVDGRVTPG
jgi:short subunit dehydrogenase-like uncharacterized protein